MKDGIILSDFMVKQFDVKKLEEIIEAFLELIEMATLILNDKDYYIKITPNYEIVLSGKSTVRNVSSKIESFMIYKYDTQDKLKELILKYPNAVHMLSKEEQKIFVKCFINKEKKSFIQDEMLLHQYQYDKLKKSTVIKFCLILGLDKYVDNF